LRASRGSARAPPQYLERCAAETGFQITSLEKVVTAEADL